jgi:uncharacterized Zn finger protein (UPF0148 family)
MVHRKKFTEVQKRLLACKQNYMCVGDGCKNLRLLPCTWELDHIQPLFQQGTNNYENLQVICPNCHALKTQRELMAAADERRETKLHMMKQRIRRMKMSMHKKNRRTEHISPYFDCRSPEFLSSMDLIRRYVHTKTGASFLSRLRYQTDRIT